MATKTLPTDKHGQVYYGPRNWPATLELAERLESGFDPRGNLCRLYRMLKTAGFHGLAARLRVAYLLTEAD